MSTKSTPGPWRAKQLGSYSQPGWVILWPDKGGTHMRRLDYQGNFTEQDARLIAAAPELLEALVHCSTDEGPEQEWLNKARAAIAKATECMP
ncbi:hypothetical protein [Acidovorax sp.]|uniref:hypothetical protein n=1 Tax=Acidovorax sp. TaxID=1872122 RepID=UPI0025BA0D20|nr:hypothetical protein [Acidovorax sp.]MBW8463527.1 hypothetical protein [Acidovorax sp.]